MSGAHHGENRDEWATLLTVPVTVFGSRIPATKPRRITVFAPWDVTLPRHHTNHRRHYCCHVRCSPRPSACATIRSDTVNARISSCLEAIYAGCWVPRVRDWHHHRDYLFSELYQDPCRIRTWSHLPPRPAAGTGKRSGSDLRIRAF